jgi:hypothetical protein
MMPASIRDLVVRAVEAEGWDGLFNEDGECACEARDLFPCCDPSVDCMLGMKCPCPPELCGEHDWHIAPGCPRGAGSGLPSELNIAAAMSPVKPPRADEPLLEALDNQCMLGDDPADPATAIERHARELIAERDAAVARAEKAEAAVVQWKARSASWAACLRLFKNDGDVADVVALIDAALDSSDVATMADTRRVDWLETQDCWIGLRDTGSEIRPLRYAGGCYRRSVRDVVDAALADEPEEE